MQDVIGAVEVKLAVGFHKVWREECNKLEKNLWPTKLGSKAVDVYAALPNKPLMKDITNEVATGDLVIFHTMVPHRFSQKYLGIRRYTYVNYDWANFKVITELKGRLSLVDVLNL